MIIDMHYLMSCGCLSREY